MKTRISIGLLFSSLLVFTSNTASAQVCRSSVDVSQFDDFYGALWGCQQWRINDMLSRFDMDKGDWDEGFGYENQCNDNLPLKRTFNALQVMAYATTNAPTCSQSSNNVGIWAYCWAGNSIDELDADCSEKSRATTSHGPFIDSRTALHAPFFYNETVVERAATIFHEARHASGHCQHVSSGTCLDGGSSCDPNWANGCVGFGSGSGLGANAFTVLYLHWFAISAQPSWTNSTVRASAVAGANYFLSRRFQTDPCFRLNSDGYAYATC